MNRANATCSQRAPQAAIHLPATKCVTITVFLLGVNKYNSSLIIADIFNSAVYKNANIAILGTSGAGKTFTMQLMALRMRRKGIQVLFWLL